MSEVSLESGPARFGARLRYWRRRAGLTQRQLADRVSYDYSFISRLESGTRNPPVRLARQADDVLEAGGELTRLALAAIGPDHGARDGERFTAFDDPTVAPWQAGDWAMWQERVRLPLGFACPVHQDGQCADLALAAAGGVEQGQPVPTVHGYLGWLAVVRRMSLEMVELDVLVPPLEHHANELVRRAENGARRHRTGLLHVAADYAYLIGRLRGELGQSATALTWLRRAASWAAATDNVPGLCRAFAEASWVALLDGDTPAAARAAVAAGSVEPRRGWTVVHGSLLEARVAARRGDDREFGQVIARVRKSVARFTDRDHREAPWLAGATGEAYLSAITAAGYRDLAARTGSVATARLGVREARTALVGLPQRQELTRLVLACRLADCLTRAGEVEEAESTAALALTAVGRVATPFLDSELRSLRNAQRAVRTWSGRAS